MIPESMLESNPTMGERSKELTEKKICKICLTETDQICKTKWNTVMATCFTTSAVITDKLPKYVCRECGDFLEKCGQFKQLCKQTELVLLSYPLTGCLPNRADTPSWLHPVKRKLKEVEVEQVDKKACSAKSNDPIQVRSKELLPVQVTLQSPTITSEVYDKPQQDTSQFQQYLNSTQPAVIQQMQTYVETFQNTAIHAQQFQYQTSPAFATPTQPSNSCPVLQQQLQQPMLSATSINHQVLIPLINQNQTIAPKQPTSRQTYRQPSQQPAQPPNPVLPVYRAIKPKPTPQQPAQTTLGTPAVPILQCNACSYLFANQHHLMAHMRKHIGNSEYRCACGRHFRQMQEYVNHLKQHTTIAWCDLCGQQFPDRDWQLGAHLDRHVQIGLSEACDFCSLVFVDLESRLVHVRSQHADELRHLMELNGKRHTTIGGWS